MDKKQININASKALLLNDVDNIVIASKKGQTLSNKFIPYLFYF